MTIAVSILFLFALLAFALLVQNGLPETMRWLALRLLIQARQIETRRQKRDADVRQILEAEAK